jgi:hypothetical protein
MSAFKTTGREGEMDTVERQGSLPLSCLNLALTIQNPKSVTKRFVGRQNTHQWLLLDFDLFW